MQPYTTIVGVIEFRLAGQSYDVVQKRYSIGSSTVTLIMNRFKEIGLSLDDLKAMEPKKLVNAFYPPESRRRKDIPMPDYQAIHERMLEMGRRADLAFLWLEYKEEHPDGYQQSQFYKYYAEYLKENFGAESATMPVERVPGEKMYIDWVGDQPELLTDPFTGEIRKVHVFTTTLGFGSCVYAEIFPDEKLASFIAGTTHALEYYGAVPKYLVPDNLKAAVQKHTKDDFVLNAAYSDLEDFYGVVVLPPPPRKPKGKSTVENHVRFLEVHLVEKLKENIYTSLEALNDATRAIVEAINQRRFQKKADLRYSRKDAFEKYDKPRMSQLPGGTYTLCDYKYFLRVPDNYHLEYDGHYYSVLYTYRGQPAILKATMSEVRICDQNNRLICKHPRSYKTFPLYVTDDSHMRPEHLYYKEVNAHDGAYYRRWASVYGDEMSTVIDRVLRTPKHEEQAYKSCAGILHLCKDVSPVTVTEAAQKCIDTNTCKYTYFKKVLHSIMNSRINGGAKPGTLPAHENIRGRDFYA